LNFFGFFLPRGEADGFKSPDATQFLPHAKIVRRIEDPRSGLSFLPRKKGRQIGTLAPTEKKQEQKFLLRVLTNPVCHRERSVAISRKHLLIRGLPRRYRSSQ
jgi:hypothetical protein